MSIRTAVVIFIVSILATTVFAIEWQEEKGDHFIVRFEDGISSQWAQTLLRHAERYYDSIAERIDYPRYKNYWSWDNRVVIEVYNDRATFLEQTNQPAWSQGGAIHRSWLTEQRRIVTYKQEENFLEGLLPHEIAHLMLIDFIGEQTPVPIFFNEGVAQLQEKGKVEKADELMRTLIDNGQYMPLEVLTQMDVRKQINPLRVAIFYAQSVSVIDFLISRYGSKRFGILCRHMRDGQPFEEALQNAYTTNIASIEELEKKWLRYMKN